MVLHMYVLGTLALLHCIFDSPSFALAPNDNPIVFQLVFTSQTKVNIEVKS